VQLGLGLAQLELPQRGGDVNSDIERRPTLARLAPAKHISLVVNQGRFCRCPEPVLANDRVLIKLPI